MARERPRKTYPDLIGERACITRCMNVDEAKGVFKNRSRWRSVVSAYPHGKKASEFMYVCMSFL